MAKAAVPVTAHLLVLLEQLNRQQQKIVEIQGVVGRQRFAITPIDIGRELAPLAFRIGLELIRQPTLVFGIADGPAGLFGLEPFGIELQLLGHDLFHQTLGVGLVVDRKLLGPGESFRVLELIDVIAEHPRKQGMEGADPQLLCHLPVNT